jgi:hypothetical protein
MKISFIIVVYNSEIVLFDCLNSIEKLEIHDNIEVILVDNHQQSRFNEDYLKKYSFNIFYFKSPKNGGFGYGNNLGVEKSNNEIVFFLNPDTVLTKAISDETIRVFKNNKEKNMILGYNLIDINHNRNNTIGSFPQTNLFNTLLLNVVSRLGFFLINNTYLNHHIWPWGAAFSIKKEVFLNSGSFDEKIFLCTEEADLLMRVENRKVKILDLSIIHLEGHTTSSSIERHTEYFNSVFYYLKKYNFSKKTFVKIFYQIYCIKNIFNLIDEDLKNKIKALNKFKK